jgi:hypothetical protein
MLSNLGTPGELALDALKQRDILLAEDVSEDRRSQILWEQQNMEEQHPVRAEEGPWSELVSGVAYARFKVVQGHLGRNELELRVLPSPSQSSLHQNSGPFRLASFGNSSETYSPVTLLRVLGGTITRGGGTAAPVGRAALARRVTARGHIGYCVSHPAQALILIPRLLPAMMEATAEALTSDDASGDDDADTVTPPTTEASDTDSATPDPDCEPGDEDCQTERNQWINKDARAKARELGYTEDKNAPASVKRAARGDLVFRKGKRWISPDRDGHRTTKGWKMFDAKGNRLGTYNTDLTTRVGD